MNPRKPSSTPTDGARGAKSAARPERPGMATAPPRPNTAQQLDQLADNIEKFKIEFERFLAGAPILPPDEQKNRLMRELRELRTANLRTSAEQFRLAALEARFNSYSELFNRRLRDREEGRGAKPVRAASSGSARGLDASSGVVVTDRLEADAVAALYATLTRRAGDASATGAPAMELTTFRGYLAQQVESIRLKTGCEAVQFRIAAEDGKLKLKAKPVHR